MALILEAALDQEFNLAVRQETRIIDLAKMINAQVGNRAGVVFAQRREWDIRSRLLASMDRAKELIGYEPNTPVEEGLKHTVAWFRENWGRISAAAIFSPEPSSVVREKMSPGGEDSKVT